ncbi:MAG: DUF411 domain-containing protein [Gammaproteobacteria bacterium]
MKHTLLPFLIFITFSASAYAENKSTKEITVYKNPACGCCNKWISYLKQNNYTVVEKNTRDVVAHKKRLGVPENLAACHTAVIDGYVIEGHVTHRDIKKLLLFRPDVTGIAVPGMPYGTPGMERGNTRQSYDVISFDKNGKTDIFSEYTYKDGKTGHHH